MPANPTTCQPDQHSRRRSRGRSGERHKPGPRRELACHTVRTRRPATQPGAGVVEMRSGWCVVAVGSDQRRLQPAMIWATRQPIAPRVLRCNREHQRLEPIEPGQARSTPTTGRSAGLTRGWERGRLLGDHLVPQGVRRAFAEITTACLSTSDNRVRAHRSDHPGRDPADGCRPQLDRR